MARIASLAVTAQLAAGRNPAWEASVVKDLGTSFEQEIPELAQLLLDVARTLDGIEVRYGQPAGEQP